MKVHSVLILNVAVFTLFIFCVEGQSGVGRTSGYWDCCKPSCAWPGKALVEQPVQSCRKDGVTPANENEPTGCLFNGTAFPCNIQQPFSVSANLAYGFASAKIAGQSEPDWCCACYALNFTSSPLRNQVMIVQITSSGSDLKDNQFDLQFPGSGSPNYYGCSSQFDTKAPSEGRQSGELFGRVESREECFQFVPAQLRQGCLFRFDWYKDANEPSVRFERYPCPIQLLEKTGCRREDDFSILS